MKHIRLFEAFINEAKVNAQEFADYFNETIAMIEEEADYDEMSNANIAYLCAETWREVAEQNNFHEIMGDMNYQLQYAKVDMDSKFHNANLSKEGERCGAAAYAATGFTLDGMIECFNAVWDQWKFCKPAQWKKVITRLENAL